MTPSHRLFDRLSRSCHVSDFATAAACHDTPGAIYVEEDVIVWSGAEELEQILMLHRRTNRELGVVRVEARIVSEVRHSERHFSAWVEWRHFGAGGQELFVIPARHFCRIDPEGEPYIQLVEIGRLPKPYNSYAGAGIGREAPAAKRRRFATVH